MPAGYLTTTLRLRPFSTTTYMPGAGLSVITSVPSSEKMRLSP
jgi:hypothetical protein